MRLARRRNDTSRTTVFSLAVINLITVAAGISTAVAAGAGAATTTWGVPTEISAPGNSGYFSGVSCVDPEDCTAVGYDGDRQPVYATEAGGVWGSAETLDTTTDGDDFGSLAAVSCVDATDCTAVGSIGDDIASVPITITERAGTWGAVDPLSDSLSSSNFRAVSCADVGDCVAVGVLGVPGGPYAPVVAVESDGTWGPAIQLSDIPGGTGPSDGLNGVSCSDATSCTAVGEDGNGQPFYVTEHDGSWGTPAQISGFPNGSGGFTAVSCTTTTDCTAVGSDGVYAIETHGVWNAHPGFFGSATLSAVSCTDAADCTAVGGKDYATEVAGAGGTAMPMSSLPGGSGAFTGVSCTGSMDCTAVGRDGKNEPFYARSQAPKSNQAPLSPP